MKLAVEQLSRGEERCHIERGKSGLPRNSDELEQRGLYRLSLEKDRETQNCCQ
jgi:hypothetical protein